MFRSVYLVASQLLVLLASGDVVAGADLFTDTGVLDVELRGPLRATVRDVRQPEERPFVINVRGADSSVMVRTRGKSRIEVCEFPPLRLHFPADLPTASIFSGMSKIKLVTHCGDGKRKRDNLLAEFAAYRMFQLLSRNSLRARLLSMRYIDTDRTRRRAVEGLAIAIEPLAIAAARLGGAAAPLPHLVKSRIDRDQAALVFVFQYFIGNSDYSLVTATGDDECCHNLVPVTVDDRLVLVPYDFDLATLVGARYATQSASYMRNRGRDRTYGGYCLDELPLENAIGFLLAHRAELLEVVEGLPWSSDAARQKRVDFVESFFAEAADGGLAERLAGRCTGGR